LKRAWPSHSSASTNGVPATSIFSGRRRQCSCAATSFGVARSGKASTNAGTQRRRRSASPPSVAANGPSKRRSALSARAGGSPGVVSARAATAKATSTQPTQRRTIEIRSAGARASSTVGA